MLMKMADRWFLHYNLGPPIPPFCNGKLCPCYEISEKVLWKNICMDTGIGSHKWIHRSQNGFHRLYPHQSQCTESKTNQKLVLKHIWQDYIKLAEDIWHSPQGKASYSLQSQTIERVFANAKEKYGMRYTLHKGLTRVRNWVRLKFVAMNLKNLAMWA